MLGKRRVAWGLRLLVADGLALFVSFVVAYGLRALLDEPLGRAAAPLGHYLWLLAPIVVVWVGLLAAFGAYGVRWTVRSRAWLALRVSAIGFVLLTAGLFLARGERDQPEHAGPLCRRERRRALGRARPGPVPGCAARGTESVGPAWRWW